MSEGEWRFFTHTRTADYDTKHLLKPSGILNLFQDAACAHSDALGVGFEQMRERNLLWVLTSVRYEVERMPQKRQAVTVVTWPTHVAGPLYGREYEVMDEEGGRMIRGDSVWALIRADSRKTALERNIYGENTVFPQRRVFEDASERLTAIKSEDVFETVCRYSEMDFNGHVNNAAYPDILWNALKPERSPYRFLIKYHKELHEGDTVTMAFLNENGSVLAEGRLNGERAFSVKMTW